MYVFKKCTVLAYPVAYECVLTHYTLCIYQMCPAVRARYKLATISRLLEIVGLFCKRALSKRRYSAEETCIFKEPNNGSHPITIRLSIAWLVHYIFNKCAVLTYPAAYECVTTHLIRHVAGVPCSACPVSMYRKECADANPGVCGPCGPCDERQYRVDCGVCVSLFVLMCGMTYSHYLWCDSFRCVTWLILICDMTHFDMWHDSFWYVTCWMLTYGMNHFDIWHGSCWYVTWLILIFDMTHFSYVTWLFYMWHDSFWYVAWLTAIWDVIRSDVCAWLVYMCMPPSDVWHASFTCVTWHALFTCVTWLIHMRDIARWYGAHGSFRCVMYSDVWCIPMCDVFRCVMYSDVWCIPMCDVLRCVTRPVHMRDMSVTRPVHMRVMSRIRIRDTTHSHAWHDLFICVTWLIHMRDITRSHGWHDSFIRVIWLIYVRDMTHSYAWHDSFIRVTWLIHTWYQTHQIPDDVGLLLLFSQQSAIHMYIYIHTYTYVCHDSGLHVYVCHDSCIRGTRRARYLLI